MIRPFSTRAEIKSREYSKGLQRVLVDFGSEESFERAAERVKEHYGIEVSVSAVRNQTEQHGATMSAMGEPLLTEMGPKSGVELLITEIDGSMIPIVLPAMDADGKTEDRRKHRELKWQEARLSMAREPEKIEAKYGACIGDVEKAGAVWLDCVIRAGGGAQTHLHVVGDGAPWIAMQVKQRFGTGTVYLCDFYHVSEYLGAAAPIIAGDQSHKWLHRQQSLLKENRLEEVIAELTPHIEPSEIDDKEAPIRVCLRYLDNRRDQLDYQSALKAGLPIGSGEIESGHRHVIQQRLKISGAWWLEGNAQKMLALRVTRSNGEWQSYWDQQRQVVT